MSALPGTKTKATVLPLDAATYVPHALHRDERAWGQTNCYVDLWIELLHGLGLDPVACLPFTLRLDFEGDQCTFFKYPLEDIEAVYGLEVHELNIWRSLPHHVVEQGLLGRPTIVELDAHYLPDTSGTTYKTGHEKTSVAIVDIDIDAKRLGYFHNSGYWVLSGDDFDGAFRLSPQFAGLVNLPPYVEVVKLDKIFRGSHAELVKRALPLAKSHLARAPKENPLTRFRGRFLEDLEWLKQEKLEVFHGYAFASLRQVGANFELLGTFLRWLEAGGETGLGEAANAFDSVSSGAKALQFKLARVVNAKKPSTGLDAMIDGLASSWDAGMTHLRTRWG